ncbi:MAG TPA: hypothetical protein VFO96_07240 [Gemmatimonadales bacterium]|nr:hypothetical protein [Gemmatimonadales bacterium]
MRHSALCIAFAIALLACGRVAAVPPAPDRCLIASLPDEAWARNLPHAMRLTSRPSSLDPAHAREIVPINEGSGTQWASLTALWSESPADSLNLQFVDIDAAWLVTLGREDSLLRGRIRWSFMHGGTTREAGDVTARWVSCRSGA